METEGDGEWLDGYHVRTRYEPRIERYIAEIDFPFQCGAVGLNETEAKQNLRDKIKAMRKVQLGS